MKLGVVYKFRPQNKINGTLFYCFEYFKYLRKYTDITLYILNISDDDFELVKSIFADKYNTDLDGVVSIKLFDLYKLQLDRTLVLDVKTFYESKEFLTNDIHCFSNEGHEMFRYNNAKTVTYYGSYDYQNYDKFCYLKLNFEIFKPIETSQQGVFVSCLDLKYYARELERLKSQFNRPIMVKQMHTGVGNLFELIDCVHYIHVVRDTNNRIIPEGFFYNKQVSIEEVYTGVDSITLRYNDIKQNGLINYTITDDDIMIKAMLDEQNTNT